MSLCAEIPQCCVCYEPFDRDVKLVRPAACGHILCKPCAEVMKDLTHKCPFHCPTPPGATYESVFIDFGLHDILSLDESKEDEYESRLTAETHDIISAETETVARLLCEVAKSPPESWAGTNTSKNNKGLVFLRACRLLRKVGNGIQGNASVKDFLHRMAVALGDLKDLCDSMTDTIQGGVSIREKLENMNESLRTDLTRIRQTLQEKEAWYARKLASQRSSHAERESQLRVDLNSMHDRWKDEQARRLSAEENAGKLKSELKNWRSSSAKYRRKYELEKLENERLRKEMDKTNSQITYPQYRLSDGQSDDSLEFESQQFEVEESEAQEDETDDTGPPSSGPLAYQSSQASSYHRMLDEGSEVLENPQPLSSSNSKLNAGSFRKMERSQSVGTLPFHGINDIERPETRSEKSTSAHGSRNSFSRAQSYSQLPKASFHTSTSGQKPKSKTKDKKQRAHMKPIIDPKLLEMCPDLANDTKGQNPTYDRKPRCLRGSKVTSMPTNPLATRLSSQPLCGPERKKQRLTMGVGDDN